MAIPLVGGIFRALTRLLSGRIAGGLGRRAKRKGKSFVKFEVEVTDLGTIKTMQDKMADTTPLLKRIGELVVSSIQRSFREQKRGDETWPERGGSGPLKNIAALIVGFNRGEGFKKQWESPRPALIGIRRLFNSMDFQIISVDTVEVGTNLDYAQDQQDGAEQSIPISDGAKDKISELLGSRKDLSRQLAPLLKKDSYDFQIKARTFVSVEEQDREDINTLVTEFFTKN